MTSTHFVIPQCERLWRRRILRRFQHGAPRHFYGESYSGPK
jgi:hypothetical protein